MSVMKLGKMTLPGLFKKPPTRKYPVEKREPYPRTRGQIEMIDIHDCIFCGMCARQCPADAIVVDKEASSWTYRPYKCIACDSCVRCCPKNDIRMLPNRPDVALSTDVEVVCALTAEEIAERERIAAEKKAKILAAKKAREEKAASPEGDTAE